MREYYHPVRDMIEANITSIMEMYDTGVSINTIASEYGISPLTLRDYLNEKYNGTGLPMDMRQAHRKRVSENRKTIEQSANSILEKVGIDIMAFLCEVLCYTYGELMLTYGISCAVTQKIRASVSDYLKEKEPTYLCYEKLIARSYDVKTLRDWFLLFDDTKLTDRQRSAASKAFLCLPERYQKILNLMIVDNKSLQEVGDIMELSRQRVQQLYYVILTLYKMYADYYIFKKSTISSTCNQYTLFKRICKLSSNKHKSVREFLDLYGITCDEHDEWKNTGYLDRAKEMGEYIGVSPGFFK